MKKYNSKMILYDINSEKTHAIKCFMRKRDEKFENKKKFNISKIFDCVCLTFYLYE